MPRQNYTKHIRHAISLMIAASVCISAPTAAFKPIDRQIPDFNTILDVNILMHRVHDAHWKINYGFSEECNHEYHANPSSELVELEKAMELALQTWLQPLREIETKRPIVDSFSFKRTQLETWEELTTEGVDLVDIQFDCSPVGSFSYASLKKDRRAAVVIRLGRVRIIQHTTLMWELVHEMGHAFGLADTYDRVRGGTLGMQPVSLMACSLDYLDGVRAPTRLNRDTIAAFSRKCLTEDDTKGILWLYRVFYENQSITDCSFSDYTFEEDTGGFRPKAPLFFGIKHGAQSYLSQIIEDNPNMDINVRDESDRTILDYAVINEYPDVLRKLLSRPDLKVNAQNSAGQTALHLAASNDYLVGVETLLKHPDLNVNTKDKQGRTPLYCAAEVDAVASVRALVQHPEIMFCEVSSQTFSARRYFIINLLD
ncbi:ankyrin repeat domain-containing protein [Candidatus Poribacteria bacterium]|nr:ankyrin repeat domain-containing protein [Candidatus Poribacteria bacterium]